MTQTSQYSAHVPSVRKGQLAGEGKNFSAAKHSHPLIQPATTSWLVVTTAVLPSMIVAEQYLS